MEVSFCSGYRADKSHGLLERPWAPDIDSHSFYGGQTNTIFDVRIDDRTSSTSMVCSLKSSRLELVFY